MLSGFWKSDGLDTDDEGKATWSVTTTVAHDHGDDGKEINSALIAPQSILSMNVLGLSPMNLCFEIEKQDKSEDDETATPKMSSMLPVVESTVCFYFQVEIMHLDAASLSVGVVRPLEFQKGYKIKGLFYNGNLTNGSAALQVAFGPYLKQGDVVLVEYVETRKGNAEDDSNAPQKTIQVKFHLNGQDLGLAFEICKDGDDDNDETFMPCLHGKGRDIQVKVQVSLQKPPPRPDFAKKPHPLVGDWILLEAYSLEEQEANRIWPRNDSDNVYAAHSTAITLHIEPMDTNSRTSGEKDEQKKDSSTLWNFTVKVCNSLLMKKTLTTTTTTALLNGGNGRCYQLEGPGMVMSTMMMPPPPLDEVETQLFQVMPLWQRIVLLLPGDNHDDNNKNTDLVQIESAPDGGKVLAKLKRKQPRDGSVPACTSYK